MTPDPYGSAIPEKASDTPLATPLRLAELAGAFSMAGDLGSGQPLGHSLRTCELALRIAQELGLRAEDQTNVYYTALLVHAGCTAGAPHLAAMLAGDELAAQRDMYLCDPANLPQILRWIGRHVSPQSPMPIRAQRFLQALLQAERTMADLDKGCSDVGAQVAKRLGLPGAMQESLFHICEMWNGKGPRKLQGDSIPLTVRIVNAAMVLQVFSTAEGPREAEAAAARFRGRSFAPDVVDAFLAAAKRGDLWDGMAQEEDPWDRVMAMEPGASPISMEERGLDDALTAFADFADFKATHTVGRSREAARLAEAAARRLRLGTEEVTLVRRAALVHDLGIVAVPSLLLDKSGPLSEVEREQVKLHPYYTQLILSRVPALQPVAAVAGMHHEWLNGQGYHQGLFQAGIPTAARIVAVTDAYLELAHAGPGRRGVGADEALSLMQQQVRTRFDPACFEALAAEVRSTAPQPSRRQEWPKDLTEREVDVLRLVSQGLSRREVAQQLVVSEHTVRHHLESIYGKI
ncbi:MAG: HD domain-containing protein, partial [Chloroflexi bacterium]|nr:HD domain-containing protein [Chloroflexota bacterium]